MSLSRRPLTPRPRAPRRAARSLLLLTILGSLAACAAADVAAAPGELLVATTDRTSYQRTDGVAPVTVLLRNQGSHVVELVGCPEPPALQLEQRVGERWEPLRSSNWVCPAIHLQRTTHLDPGAELTGRILVDAPGDYRARVFIGARTDGTNPSVVTGTFAVR